MKFYFFTLLFLLTMVSFSLAVDTTGLLAYYSMNDLGNQTLEDNHNSYDLIIGTLGNGTIETQGLFSMDTGMRFPSWNTQTRFYTSLGFNLTKQDFCVNAWQKNIPMGYSSMVFTIGNNVTLRNTVYISNNNIRLYNASNYVAGNTTPLNLSNWNMITYCNDQTNYYLYVNGQLIRQSSLNFLPNANAYLSLGVAYTVGVTNYSTYGTIDELSVWSVKLSNNAILQLYNTGIGMSYTQLSEGGSATNQEYWYNVCIGNQLCKILEINGTSASCTQNNTVFCFSPCFDQQSNYDAVGYSPANRSYDGHCGLCQNECTAENSTQCYDSINIQICHMNSNGCYQWYNSYCGDNYFCDMQTDTCQAYTTPINNGSTVPIGTTTQNDQDLWANFFNLDSSSANNKLLIAILAIIICTVAGLGILLAIQNASGGKLPSFISVGIMTIFFFIPTFYFIGIGFIPFWILIITIILIAFGVGTFVTSKVFRGT